MLLASKPRQGILGKVPQIFRCYGYYLQNSFLTLQSALSLLQTHVPFFDLLVNTTHLSDESLSLLFLLLDTLLCFAEESQSLSNAPWLSSTISTSNSASLPAFCSSCSSNSRNFSMISCSSRLTLVSDCLKAAKTLLCCSAAASSFYLYS